MSKKQNLRAQIAITKQIERIEWSIKEKVNFFFLYVFM